MRVEKNILAFNRGVVSDLGLARLDVEKLQLAAEVQSNYVPRVLGSMMLRPGMEYQNNTLNNNKARHLPFVFAVNDTALIELTNKAMRVKVDDEIVTRPSVAPPTDFGAGNTDFTSNITGWDTTDTETGAVTPAYDADGYMTLKGNGVASSIAKSSITVGTGTQCGIKIGLYWGPVDVSVGTDSDPDLYFERSSFGRGVHSLQLTVGSDPDVYVYFYNRFQYSVYVDYCKFDTGNSDNELELETPWATADLPNLRSRAAQSGDIIHVGCEGHQQRKLERRDNNSWSIVYYEPADGPFRVQNTTPTTVAANVIYGDITLTASERIFTKTQVGSLFRMASQGQTVENIMTSIDSSTEKWSDPIRVVGIEDGRKFLITLADTGGWGGSDKVYLQYSIGAIGSWVDSSEGAPGWTADQTNLSIDDDQDNQIIYYRIGVKTADVITNTVTATLTYTAGSITGVARITAYTNRKNVSAHVLKDFGSTDATADWWEAAWSDRRSFPTALALHESRLFHAGQDKIWGSASDNYESFDDDFIGDSETIARTIGFGPRQSVHWLLPLAQMVMGTADNSSQLEPVSLNANNPIAARSSSFGEPLTPTNFNLRTVNARGVFVDRTKQRLYELAYKSDASVMEDYGTDDLSLTTPDFNEIGIVHIEVQHKPDTRIHCVRSDGTVGMLVFDRAENVTCWIDILTDGEVEDVVVLPGAVEDQVYYTIKRRVGGGNKRFQERWALESEAVGGLMNKQADSFVTYEGAATTTITGLDHLNGDKVVVWGDGKDLTEYDADGVHTGPTVASGQITISTSSGNVCVGLRYEAIYVSNKLIMQDDPGLNERRNVKLIGLMLRKTHRLGLQYGPDVSRLYDMPAVEDGQVLEDDKLWDHYEKGTIPFGGSWKADSRIVLKSAAPRPCTVLAAKVSQNVGRK